MRGRVVRDGLAAGAVAAVASGTPALDVGMVGRRFPRVRALPTLPQLADHAVYGATVGVVLGRRRRAIIQP